VLIGQNPLHTLLCLFDLLTYYLLGQKVKKTHFCVIPILSFYRFGARVASRSEGQRGSSPVVRCFTPVVGHTPDRAQDARPSTSRSCARFSGSKERHT
jgi:hypothetical protein